jgi:hypothetical protein
MPRRNAVDSFYTPTWLARELAEAMPANLEGRVLDPSAGAGALLAGVRDRFGEKVTLVGIDVDAEVVGRLRRAEPKWLVSHADILTARSRRSSRAWRAASDDIAAVVLNPPFSYRGNGGDHINYGEFNGRVAPAMHFLVEVLRDLAPTSGVFAILPDGAIDAQKHQALWTEIRQRFDVVRLRRFKPTTFLGARVSTSLVRLIPGTSGQAPIEITTTRDSPVTGCRCVEVIRGRVPVHKVRDALPAVNPAPFFHTTTLSTQVPRFTAAAELSDEAPLVVITRVGRWSEPTVVDLGRIVLSDCLIALRPKSRAHVDALRASVEEAGSEFRQNYRGTGARYLTLDAVVRELETLGWHPHVVKASSGVGDCCCELANFSHCRASALA